MTDNPLLHSFLLNSFFVAGLECSTHRRRDGARLDLLEASAHARFAYQDFCRLKRLGVRCRSQRLALAPGRTSRTALWTSARIYPLLKSRSRRLRAGRLGFVPLRLPGPFRPLVA